MPFVDERAEEMRPPEEEGGPGAARWRAPMLASLARLPEDRRLFEPGGWVFERKLDGLRCLAVRNGQTVNLWSRNRLTFTARFPAIAARLAALPAGDFTVDGEIVAFDAGRSSFALLQRPRPGTRPVFCAFDVLHLLGHDTTPLPLEDRAGLLARVLGVADAPAAPAGPGATREGPDPRGDGLIGDPTWPVCLVGSVAGDAAGLLSAACSAGWEGLIAKRVGSSYRPGRSADWRKLKCVASQELVVGGWTDPAGTRTAFGALLVGYYDERGALRYAGRVGGGFSEAELRRLRRVLEGLSSDRSPFADAGPPRGSHWVRPELVVAVTFSEWTPDGRLRHPRFGGVRPDKSPREVRRETPPAP